MQEAKVNTGDVTQLTINRQAAALAKMRDKFPDGEVGYRPVPLIDKDEYKKLPKDKCKICGGYHATTKTGHLSYVGHAAITNRLLDCDPLWELVPLALDADGLPKFDASGGLWAWLTVSGMKRLCYGNSEPMPYSEKGAREKAVIGDTLRNGCMRFGAALELWHKGTLGEPDPVMEYGPVESAVKVESTGKPAVVMPLAYTGHQPVGDNLKGGSVNTHVDIPKVGDTRVVTSVDVAENGDIVKFSVQDKQAANADSEPLAEAGEVKFITNKLGALKSTDVPKFLTETIGTESLVDLTKANFLLLKEAIKGKK